VSFEIAQQRIAAARRQNSPRLNLSWLKLDRLPPELFELPELQVLWLRGNKLTSLPPEFGRLKQLRRLRLELNQLAALPEEIGALTELRELLLYDNELERLPETIGQLTQLRVLALNGNRLTAVPATLGQCRELRRLYLGNWISLPGIRHDSDRGNQLTAVPEELGQLSNLQTLWLENNKLMLLPVELGQLSNLQTLWLENNKLMLLPVELGQLSNLQWLNLTNNQLTVVPVELGQLSSLQRLWLNNNQLTAVPVELAQLSNLQFLGLYNNQLTAVPMELAQLKSLWIFAVSENPFRYPPEIVEGGDEEIRSYLRALDGAEREWISKLIVVGQGGVGKTSLLRALREEPFDEGEGTTHGIEIKELGLAHPTLEGVTMQLATWDFAGQEIAHATHQFFLTNRSLYVLVWNARHGYEQGKLFYWLDTIKLRAPNSPIIVVAAHTDEREADLPLAELRKAYPQIVDHLEISNKTGAGIERLCELIRQTAADLPLMGEEWPPAWAKVRHAIRALAEKHNHITPNDLTALLDEHEVTGTQARVLTKWLHELGEILFFQDKDELNDTVILNSHWVTEAIGHVLASNEVVEQLGIFTREHMNRLWAKLTPAMREHFLRLMEQFDLSYRILEDKDKSLVIERVPYDPPDYATRWQSHKDCTPCREIKMRFVLDATMPAGIPTWFIARSHRFSLRTHWRHGALFGDDVKTPVHLGLVQAMPHDRYVMLTVRGPAPQNFFALLRDGLEVTFKRFPGLGITRKVPCCGHNGEVCAYEFDLAHLEKRLERGKETIECNLSGEDVDVAKMLYGIDRGTTEAMLAELLKHAETHERELQELRTYAQREFTKWFNAEQHKEESQCPYVFILRGGSYDNDLQGLFSGTGIRGGVITELRDRVWKRKVELQLYCQMPGHWHPCGYERGKDDPATGLYQVELNAELAQAMATYLPTMVKWLRFARPLVFLITGVPIPLPDEDKLAAHLKQDCERMEKLAAQVQETNEMKLAKRLDETGDAREASGALLRNLRRLLEEKDKQQTWGGLKRILTKEGHHLWLCPHHLAAYK
jgi:internalin A